MAYKELEKEFRKKFGKFNAWRDVGDPKLEEHFSPDDIWRWIKEKLTNQQKGDKMKDNITDILLVIVAAVLTGLWLAIMFGHIT